MLGAGLAAQPGRGREVATDRHLGGRHRAGRVLYRSGAGADRLCTPTIDLLQEFSREKLTPTIEQTPALVERIKRSDVALGDRLDDVETVPWRVAGAAQRQLGAGSPLEDPEDRHCRRGRPVGGRSRRAGRSLEMFLGRFTAFHATGEWQVLALSTPRLFNASRIDSLYKRGDQRLGASAVRNAATEIALEVKHLRYERRPPYRAEYIAQCCGWSDLARREGWAGPRGPFHRHQSGRALPELPHRRADLADHDLGQTGRGGDRRRRQRAEAEDLPQSLARAALRGARRRAGSCPADGAARGLPREPSAADGASAHGWRRRAAFGVLGPCRRVGARRAELGPVVALPRRGYDRSEPAAPGLKLQAVDERCSTMPSATAGRSTRSR